MTTISLSVAGIFPLIVGKIYRNSCGGIGLPVSMLNVALNEAVSTLWSLREGARARHIEQVESILKIRENFLTFQIPKGSIKVPWVTDRRVATFKGRSIVCARPKFKEWGFTCTVVFDEKVVEQTKILEVFRIAGMFHGLGIYNPSCNGPFGRFAVKEFRVV